MRTRLETPWPRWAPAPARYGVPAREIRPLAATPPPLPPRCRVGAGGQSALGDGVADEDGALHSLAPQNALENRGGEMMPVGNDAAVEFVSGQLLPDVVGMPRKQRVGSVSQVGRETGAGRDGGVQIVGRSVGVTDGGHDACFRQALDEGDGPVQLGRQRHQQDFAFGGFLHPEEFVPRGQPDMSQRVGSPGSVQRMRCADPPGGFPGSSRRSADPGKRP